MVLDKVMENIKKSVCEEGRSFHTIINNNNNRKNNSDDSLQLQIEDEQVTQRLIRPVPKIGNYFNPGTKVYIHFCLQNTLTILHTEEHIIQNKQDILKMFVPMIRDLKEKGYKKGGSCILALSEDTTVSSSCIFSSPFRVVPKRKTENLKKKEGEPYSSRNEESESSYLNKSDKSSPSHFNNPFHFSFPNPPPLAMHNSLRSTNSNTFGSSHERLIEEERQKFNQQEERQKPNPIQQSQEEKFKQPQQSNNYPISPQNPPLVNFIATIPSLTQAYARTRTQAPLQEPPEPFLKYWSVGFDSNSGARVFKFSHSGFDVSFPEESLSFILTAYGALDSVAKNIDISGFFHQMQETNGSCHLRVGPGGPHDILAHRESILSRMAKKSQDEPLQNISSPSSPKSSESNFSNESSSKSESTFSSMNPEKNNQNRENIKKEDLLIKPLLNPITKTNLPTRGKQYSPWSLQSHILKEEQLNPNERLNSNPNERLNSNQNERLNSNPNERLNSNQNERLNSNQNERLNSNPNERCPLPNYNYLSHNTKPEVRKYSYYGGGMGDLMAAAIKKTKIEKEAKND